MIAKVIDLENIKIVGINKKYNVNKKGRMYLSDGYRVFKKMLVFSCVKTKIPPPYHVKIKTHCYHDIDAVTKVILDAIQTAGVIDDDKNVLMCTQYKMPISKNTPGKIQVEVSSLVGLDIYKDYANIFEKL